jgi:hypothetical protein
VETARFSYCAAQQRLYFFPEPQGHGAFRAGSEGASCCTAAPRLEEDLRCCTSKYAVIPTSISHTTTSPTLSRVVNIPDTRNQIKAAVQITIQTTPYHGLLIFFMTGFNTSHCMRGFRSAEETRVSHNSRLVLREILYLFGGTSTTFRNNDR